MCKKGAYAGLIGFGVRFSGFLLISLLGITSAANITFLGFETTVIDRDIGKGKLLSEVIAGAEQGCDGGTIHDFTCIKKAIGDLNKSKIIKKTEEKIFKDLIVRARHHFLHGTTVIKGRVTTPAGAALDAVTIVAKSSGTETKSTETAQGLFCLKLKPDTKYVLQFSAQGFADQVKPILSPKRGQSINMEITMIPRGSEQKFTTGSGELSGADGAGVNVNGIGWVDGMGNAVSGEISVTITPVDVSNSADLDAFPGDFKGIAAGETNVSDIVSYGVAEFEFSQNGREVQPAAGQLVPILIPIYFKNDQTGNPLAVGDEVPLWSLNETDGVWKQEGAGTVVALAASPTGLALSANVGHFSWWNCDVTMNPANAYITVFGDKPGTAVVRASTAANIGWRPSTVETVTPVGLQIGPLYIPSNGEVCFYADITFDDGSTATTLTECRNPGPNEDVYIELYAPTSGPLNITTNPPSLSPVLEVTGYAGYPVTRVTIFPTTLETSVLYSIFGGSLPTGLSLVQIMPTKAEIAGIPTVAGENTVTIQGDDGSETDTISIHYNISSDVPPPVFKNDYIYVYDSLSVSGITYDLNNELDLVNGGAATTWTLVQTPNEGSPVPDWAVLDSVTGILTITTGDNEYWYGIVKAINASGEDEADISIMIGFIPE